MKKTWQPSFQIQTRFLQISAVPAQFTTLWPCGCITVNAVIALSSVYKHWHWPGTLFMSLKWYLCKSEDSCVSQYSARNTKYRVDFSNSFADLRFETVSIWVYFPCAPWECFKVWPSPLMWLKWKQRHLWQKETNLLFLSFSSPEEM